ncbi:MAG TPA: hypothetical protein VK029_07985 [Pseudogracilibacillus sp.]|nr:hypothetical protein [Pseudogracilibacillus sp.]
MKKRGINDMTMEQYLAKILDTETDLVDVEPMFLFSLERYISEK